MLSRLTVFFLFVFLTSLPVHAETLKDMVGKMEVLPMKYGANNLHINDNDILVVRGEFKTGTAWGRDAYTVLVRENDVWQMVHHEKRGWSGVLTETQPHTYEDSIVTVRFMASKNTVGSGNVDALYLLKASRPYMQDESGKTDTDMRETKVTFILYALWRDKDFGIPYWHEIAKAKSTIRYCNADWAMWRELGVTLPSNDENAYECPESK